MTMIKARHPLVVVPQDIQLAAVIRLAMAIYCRAQKDARRDTRHCASAQAFLTHDSLAQSIGEVAECDEDGRMNAKNFVIESRYFIEINDPNESGRRGLTDEHPVVIRGYVQPLKRNQRGVSSVIIVEEPSGFAALWKAVPTDEWIDLGDDYAGVAGMITEREYALLLAHVPGIATAHVSSARRRAMRL
jgi:hypothetical protein